MKKDNKKLALWSFILGLAGILEVFCIYVVLSNGMATDLDWIIMGILLLSPVLWIGGFILGIKALNSSRKKIAMSGMVLCFLGVALNLFIFFSILHGVSQIQIL